MGIIDSLSSTFRSSGFKGVGASVHQKVSQRFRDTVLNFGIRSLILKSRVKHVYGPSKVLYASDELLVVCIVRNGELYIKSFMEHYRSLGVKHFVFMDNLSTDRTIELLCSYDNVTVLQTDVTFIKYESTIRRYMAERFSKGRWNLVTDIDELFDYPYSKHLSLCRFLQYLDEHQYTAVICQMLNLFSDIPFSKLESHIDDSLQEKYPYYDNSAIDKTEYRFSEPANKEIKMYLGGIYKTLFDTYSGLTKAALVKMNGRVKTFVYWHHVRNAKVADISCVLKHYNFIGTFYEKLQDSMETKRYGEKGASDFHSVAWQRLQRNPELSPKLETARRLVELESLIEEDFLIVSEEYKLWVKNYSR